MLWAGVGFGKNWGPMGGEVKGHVGRRRNGRGSNERTIGEGEKDGLQDELAMGGLP